MNLETSSKSSTVWPDRRKSDGRDFGTWFSWRCRTWLDSFLAGSHIPSDRRHTMKTALVVDDEKDFRRLVSRYLTRKGWQVLEASNYLEAMPLTKQCDIIILDYSIGDPNGEVLLSDTRKEENLVPVVMISGVMPLQETIQRFYELGIFHYIAKPMQIETLYSTLDRATKIVDLLDSAEQQVGHAASVMAHA